MKFVKLGIFALALGLFTVSCENDQTRENEDSDATEYMEETGEDVENAAENTANDIDTTIDRAAEDMEESLETKDNEEY